MAICVELHTITAGTSLKVDGVGYTTPYGVGTQVLIPSITQNETNCTSFIVQTPSAASGVALDDALVCSWLVVAVWAVAFYFRTARTAVRGY
ncbi:MAG: hypothetical protein WC504_01945 [Methylobacter sp.]